MSAIRKIEDLIPAAPDPVVAGDLVYQRLSAMAYQDEKIAGMNASQYGFSLIEHFHDDVTGADAMMFLSADELVIAFRGTQRDYRDIVTDLKFRTIEKISRAGGPAIRVHRGFMEQFRGIRHEIRAAYAAASKNVKRTVVTGHSLGGALAVLASIEWCWIDLCVTFGAPRVGDAPIRQAMKVSGIRHRRYVFGADVVPVLPLIAMGYRHDCAPVYLTRGRRAVHGCPLWRELVGRARALLTTKWKDGWSWCPVPARIYTDHRIGEYGAAMTRIGASGTSSG